jgi:hypothetical protein
MYNDGTQDKLIRELAKERGLDPRVVKNVVYYPIRFAKTKMENPVNNRPIRIRYLGIFTQKTILNKDYLYDLRVKSLLGNIVEVAVMMAAVLGFPIINEESARSIITSAHEQKDYEKLQLIWDEWSYYGTRA